MTFPRESITIKGKKFQFYPRTLRVFPLEPKTIDIVFRKAEINIEVTEQRIDEAEILVGSKEHSPADALILLAKLDSCKRSLSQSTVALSNAIGVMKELVAKINTAAKKVDDKNTTIEMADDVKEAYKVTKLILEHETAANLISARLEQAEKLLRLLK